MKTLVLTRNLIVSILTVMLLTYSVQGVSYAQEAPDTIVEFNDIILATVVRRALGLPTGDGIDLLNIPKSELVKLTELKTTRNKDINDLTGLEHASQLTVLNLAFNDISDLTPLTQLTQLEYLYLNSNFDISDLTPLAQLTQLEELTLYECGISDVTPLAQLTQLEYLDLRSNYISNVTPLLGLTSLKKLYLELNLIKDLSPLMAYLDANPDVELDIAKYFIWEEGGPTLIATTDQPLTGATLDYARLTLTLNSGAFRDDTDIAKHITISGISDISRDIWDWVTHITDDQRTFELLLVLNLATINGAAITTDSVLTVTVGPEAIPYYNGPALTAQIPIRGVTEAELAELSQAVVASTPYPLTEATLNGSIVTLKLTDGTFVGNADENFITRSWDTDIGVSGIAGVTLADAGWINDTEIMVELRFSGYINTDTTLIVSVGPGSIHRYNGPRRTAEIPVSATSEEPTGKLVASTQFPLTKATLDSSFVVLTLQNDSHSYRAGKRVTYIAGQQVWQQPVGISGVRDVQTVWIDNKPFIRLSRSKILVKIDFQGDFDTDVTLTFTVPPSLIENYNGPPLTAALPVAVVTELRVLTPEFQQHSLYWINVDTGKIESVGPFDAVTQAVTTLAVDRIGGKLYWSEQSKSGGIIKRANFDGTYVETLASLSSVPLDITIDAVGNQIYWTNSDLQIQTATLNVEDIRTVIQLEKDFLKKTVTVGCSSYLFGTFGCEKEIRYINLTTPSDITLNTVDGRLYWTELSGRIRRVNLDGTNVETLISDLETPYGIAVVDDKVYWAEEVDENSGKIQRANLNGTNIETLATVYGIPFDISIDTATDKIYWANSLRGIQRTDLNGGEVEAVVSGITVPVGFVLVPGVQPTTPPIATTNATVSISPASVASPAIGEQLEFSLNIADGKAVAGYQATVQFDDTALRYVSGVNGDFLPTGAFFTEPTVKGNFVQLNAASLAGESNGDGTLATLTFEVVGTKASALTLSNVLLSNSAGEIFVPRVENASDVNGDGTVNIADLVLVASNLDMTGENDADVNGDGVVDVADLVLVAGAIRNSAAAPSLLMQSLETFAAADVKQWLSAAEQLNLTDIMSQRGILFLQQLLVALTPKETALLANYPNPFNPETWIPYHLSKDADVTLHIYAMNGTLVRTLALGHQAAGMYQSRSRAIYWDGRNAFGEPVASGLYFYTLTAGDFSATRKMLIRK